MPLPPYDNKEYRYCHSDRDRREGLAKVASLLRLPSIQDQTGLLYDLSYFSGGIGVDDHLAVTMPASATVWATVLAARPTKTPEETAGDPALAEDFVWLICRDQSSLEIRAAAVAFINSERRDFQPECRRSDRILFSEYSDVNDWFVLWGTDDQLHCLAFSQG